MNKLCGFRLPILIMFWLGTFCLHGQTPCDTIFSYNGKKIPARNIVLIKDEIKYVPCRGDLTNEIYVPVNQVTGYTSNGSFKSVQEIKVETENKEIKILVEEQDPPTTALLSGRILLGLTASTPNSFALPSGNSNNVGVQFGKNLNSGSDSDITVINISPIVGYSPIDHVLVGIATSYNTFKVEEENISAISINPFVRGYYPGSEKLMPFAEFGWHFISSKIGEDNTISGSGFTGKLGTSFFFNKYISLDLFCAYQRLVEKRPLEFTGSEIKYTFGQFGLGVGFSVFLN